MQESGTNVGILSPWEIHARKIEALLSYDRAVDGVAYDDETHEIKVFVNGDDKAAAIQSLLVDHLDFGNVSVDVRVIPSNVEPDEAELFSRAFEGNELFSCMLQMTTPHGVEENFAVFEPVAVQYYSDDIGSAFGVTTVTPEQLAKDVLVQGTVRICSDTL